MNRWICLVLLAFAPVLSAGSLATNQSATTYLQDSPDNAGDDEGDSPEIWQIEAEQALRLGRWKAARSLFKKILKQQPTSQTAARGLAKAYGQVGDYKRAVKALTEVIEQAKATEYRTLVILARNQITLGDYDDAQKNADTLVKHDDFRAKIDGWLLTGNLRRIHGDYPKADEAYAEIRTLVEANRNAMGVDKSKPEPLLADLWCSAGEAYFHMNRLSDANDSWANALDAYETHLRTNDWMARLYLEQNHDVSSLNNYALTTLRQNENSADMHFRAAMAYYFRWNTTDGNKHMEDALKINKDHPEALTARAVRYINNDRYELGAKDYNRALKTNPHNIRALGAKALHAATLGLDDLMREAEEAVLSVNPNPAEFYEIIADGLSGRFRYVECLPYYRKALKSNPKHYTAYRGMGLAAMNMGDDKLGMESLQTALDKDPFRNNLQTLNLLTLLKSYKNYDRFESEDGRFRLLVHKKESAVMKDYYLDILQTAFIEQSEKYGFTPRVPITVESFPNHADFEVRTIGITGLPALGACFGQLITLDSPSARPAGSYNWASTVRHEMDHVFQIQISNGQVPRWLAEGLSSYEEKRTRPEWERHLENQLFDYYHRDDIPAVKAFNEWFRDGRKVMFAYYLGNVMCEFIDKRMGGYKVLSEMLRLFGKKKTPDQVFEETLKMKPEEFDAKFLDYVRERIAHLRMLHPVSDKKLEELYFKYEDGEAKRSDYVDLALGYMRRGSRIDTETFLGLATKYGADKVKGPDGARYWYTRSMLARSDPNLEASQRPAKAKEYLDKAIGCGLEDYQTFLTLAQQAGQARNFEMLEHWLKEASRAWKESPAPYQGLFQLYQQTRRPDKAVEMAEKWMAVDENNLGTRLWLITNHYLPKRQWSKVAEMSLQAIYVAPLDANTHRFRAMGLRKLKKYDEAVSEYRVVIKLASGTAEEAEAVEVGALLDIAATWLNAEKLDKCRDALNEAKKLDPDNPRIKTIEDELDSDEEEDDF